MAPYAILALILSMTGVGLVMGLKASDQRWRDQNRKTYRLSFPSDLEVDHVVAMLRAISSTLHKGRLGGSPTIAFEMWSNEQGIMHRVKVPWQQEDYIIQQLLAHIPGLRYEPEEEFPTRRWNHGIEAGLKHSGRTLFIPEPDRLSHSILKTMEGLEPPETIIVQWVITPAARTIMPVHKEATTDRITLRSLTGNTEANRDEVNDRRLKMQEPNFLAVLRIGATAQTIIRAEHLVDNVRKSIAQTQTGITRYRSRYVPKKALQRRIEDSSGVLDWPMRLSATELAALIAWPLGSPTVAGLPQARARHLAAPESVPRMGRIIGHSTLPGRERRIAISYEDALKHVHVMGPTGVGKTALLANMLKQDMENGYGVILIESKGDLFHAALDYVPAHRLQDVIVLDVNDTGWPVGFNILDQGDPRVVVDELCALFDFLYRDARGVWTREVLYHGLKTLIRKGGLTFIDLATLLMPMSKEEVAWADDMRRAVDPEIRQFWQTFENKSRTEQDRMVQPVMDRIWQLTARAELRNIIGQSKSSFQMSDVIKDNKILLINFKNLAPETAGLTGTLLINALWHAVKTTQPEKSNFLYLDEFQDFLNLPISPQDMLAKARSMKLGLTLAHQDLGQLSRMPGMEDAIMSNARSKVVFQMSSRDARSMAREFGKSVTDNDLMHLGQFEAVSRVATGGGVSSPMTLVTEKPAKSSYMGKQAIATSRSAYARPIEDVRAEIADRHVPSEPKNEPRKLPGGWG